MHAYAFQNNRTNNIIYFFPSNYIMKENIIETQDLIFLNGEKGAALSSLFVSSCFSRLENIVRLQIFPSPPALSEFLIFFFCQFVFLFLFCSLLFLKYIGFPRDCGNLKSYMLFFLECEIYMFLP